MSHSHSGGTKDTGSTFKLGLILNTGFTIFEMVAGIVTGSLALIADATHNLTDSLTLGIAYIADKISKRQPNEKQSYGYGRAKIIASLLNAGILLAIASFIGYEAIKRLGAPTEIPGLIVSAVAAIGIAINGSIAYLLSKKKHDLNAKSAYTNMLYDTLSSVGAVLAGFAIALYGWNWLDSAVGIVIALMLLFATFGIIKDAVHILLEGVPSDIDIQRLKKRLITLDYVIDIDDIHAWTIDSDYYAFSCHLIVAESDLPHSRKIVEQAKEILAKEFKFKHSTIEVELEDRSEHTDHDSHQ
jgi:cobalt-zinc-cadmium efflux system protein